MLYSILDFMIENNQISLLIKFGIYIYAIIMIEAINKMRIHDHEFNASMS